MADFLQALRNASISLHTSKTKLNAPVNFLPNSPSIAAKTYDREDYGPGSRRFGWLPFVDDYYEAEELTKSEFKEVKKAIVALNKMLENRINELEKWDKNAKKEFEQYFGSASKKNRDKILKRLKEVRTLLESLKDDKDNFLKTDKPGVFAHVYKDDEHHKVVLDKAFWDAKVDGTDSQSGTLGHELSHFEDIGDTEDYAKEYYGVEGAKKLAKEDPKKSLSHADTFEYYLEDAFDNR